MKYQPLYISWGVLFALCAALGFVPSPEGAMLMLLRILTVAFFIPPVMILVKARAEAQPFHIRLIRNLAIGWLAAAVILLCANLVSVNAPAFVGNVLHGMLTVACAPLVCSNAFLLPIFLWGMLLTATLVHKE